MSDISDLRNRLLTLWDQVYDLDQEVEEAVHIMDEICDEQSSHRTVAE